jgi:hypothetical protein
MSQRSSGSIGPGSDDWPDDLWPDDDDRSGGRGRTEGGASAGPQAAPPMPAARPEDGPPRRRFRPAVLLAIALLAAAAGAGIVLAVDALTGSSTTPGAASQPSSLAPVAPGGNGQSGGALPGSGSGGTGMLFVIGKVTAVSSRSITIGGSAHTVTAAVTSSTRVTGDVSGISAVKVGDQVSAQIVQNGGRPTASAIQDPAQSPPGGSAP